MGNGKRPALWSIPLEGEVARAVWGQMGEGGGGGEILEAERRGLEKEGTGRGLRRVGREKFRKGNLSREKFRKRGGGKEKFGKGGRKFLGKEGLDKASIEEARKD